MTIMASLISLAIGALLLGLITKVAVPPAAWVALVLLLHASRSLPAVPGAAFLWAAAYVALVVGNRGIVPVQGVAYFAVIAALSTTVVLPFVVDRVVASGIGAPASTLIFPITLVAVEFLRSRFTTAATWNSFAYTQYGCLPIMQIAALAGIWGITFVIGWGASTFEWAWARNFEWPLVRIPLLTCGTVLGLIAFSGALRVALAPSDQPSMRAAALNRPLDLFMPGEMTKIASGRVSADERPYFAGKLARLRDWFLEGSRREAAAGARLVAWPEQNLLIFADDESAFLARARKLAATERIYLVMGLGTVHLGRALPLENKSVVIDPSGRVLASYLKSHAVSGWEASVMQRGDGGLPVVRTEDGRLATAICFDADFPEFMRQAGRGSADLLVVPANDWREIKGLHARMAAFRAIENGVPLLRSAASGLSTAVDPWGRVLAVSDYFSPGDRTMTAQMPVGHVSTLYARTGDLFAWLCVGGVLAAAAFRFI
jgi:apolipoprotein N-acyltransferase